MKLSVKLFRHLTKSFGFSFSMYFRHTNFVRTLEQYQLNEFLEYQSAKYSNSYYIDFGANTGEIAELMIGIFNPVRTILIEPQPHLADSLKQRFTKSEIYQKVVGGTSQTELLHFAKNSTDTVSQSANIFQSQSSNSSVIEVQNIHVQKLGVDFSAGGVMKIDIEGAELVLLRDLTELNELRAWCILVEDHSHLYSSTERLTYRRSLKYLINKLEKKGNLVIKWI